MARAHSLSDLERELSPTRGLLIDLKGSTTLGELYLDADAGSQPIPASANSAVVAILRRALDLCAAGECRSAAHHRETGYYARRFARGEARAFAGYSEMLHFAAEEAKACSPLGRCLDPRELDAVRLPLSDRGARPVAFADVLTIRAGCEGACLERARAFIGYLTSEEATLRWLLPDGIAPRYLLPARTAVYQDPRLLAAAPLYPKLRELIGAGRVIREPGLPGRLRALGNHVDVLLGGPTR